MYYLYIWKIWSHKNHSTTGLIHLNGALVLVRYNQAQKCFQYDLKCFQYIATIFKRIIQCIESSDKQNHNLITANATRLNFFPLFDVTSP